MSDEQIDATEEGIWDVRSCAPSNQPNKITYGMNYEAHYEQFSTLAELERRVKELRSYGIRLFDEFLPSLHNHFHTLKWREVI